MTHTLSLPPTDRWISAALSPSMTAFCSRFDVPLESPDPSGDVLFTPSRQPSSCALARSPARSNRILSTTFGSVPPSPLLHPVCSHRSVALSGDSPPVPPLPAPCSIRVLSLCSPKFPRLTPRFVLSLSIPDFALLPILASLPTLSLSIVRSVCHLWRRPLRLWSSSALAHEESRARSSSSGGAPLGLPPRQIRLSLSHNMLGPL
jgi:hypothetical protein